MEIKYNHIFDATAIAEAIKAGKITPLEAVQATIDAIKNNNEKLNAVVHLYEEEALEKAKNLKDYSDPKKLDQRDEYIFYVLVSLIFCFLSSLK
ncbi:hypothetical protein [Eremococcus coleocola]|uniref:hypothetical protein n=1 Tax=Eremococcus coleocola TaxID=88132 RepID=UPI000429E170|nr:hypothetical protein [Eremococcus coleocola]